MKIFQLILVIFLISCSFNFLVLGQEDEGAASQKEIQKAFSTLRKLNIKEEENKDVVPSEEVSDNSKTLPPNKKSPPKKQKPKSNEELEELFEQTVQALQGLSGDQLDNGAEGVQKTKDGEIVITNNPFALSSEEDLALTMEKHPFPPIRWVMNKFPKIKKISVKILKNDDAVLGWFAITKKKEEMKNYSMTALVFMGVLIIWSFFGNKNKGFFRRLFNKFIMFIVAIIGQFVIFYWYFGTEIQPTLDVIMKNL